jgi:hypothetical protein
MSSVELSSPPFSNLGKGSQHLPFGALSAVRTRPIAPAIPTGFYPQKGVSGTGQCCGEGVADLHRFSGLKPRP